MMVVLVLVLMLMVVVVGIAETDPTYTPAFLFVVFLVLFRSDFVNINSILRTLANMDLGVTLIFIV